MSRYGAGCAFDGCDRPHKSRGYCSAHYWQFRRGKDLTPIRLLARWKGPKDVPCYAPDCEIRQKSQGLCSSHYAQMKRGEELRPLRLQTRIPPSGRGAYTDDGYVRLHGIQYKDHPNARRSGKSFLLMEHHLVMSEMIGRGLLPGESVHHKNGMRDDNRPENLELWTKAQPAGQRVDDKVAFAIELLRLYAPDRLAS